MAGNQPEPAGLAVRAEAAGFKIAGFGVGFKSDSPGIISVLRRRYSGFISRGRGDFSFFADSAPGRQNPFRPAFSREGGRLKIERGDFTAALDLGSGLGTLSAVPREQCLDAFLRSFLSSILIRSGGFMLHSAGIVKDGKAYLFLGKSGAGKSTLARLAAASGRAEVVSDEINMLRYEKGRFRVYGSPFWGEMRSEGRPGSWPLGGVFLLEKGKAHRTAPCGVGETLRRLLRCVVNFEKGPGLAGLVMKNAGRLLAGAKFSRLEFSKNDAGFLEFIK